MALKHAHDDKLYLPGLSNTEILISAFEASQKLEWDIDEVTSEGARFEVPFNMYSRGEKRTFAIEQGNDGEVSIHSQSSSIQMEEIKASLTPEEPEEDIHKLYYTIFKKVRNEFLPLI